MQEVDPSQTMSQQKRKCPTSSKEAIKQVKSDHFLFLGPHETQPNLIIQLLHINVNNNYFEFASLIFQQIKGTAVGAQLSPQL